MKGTLVVAALLLAGCGGGNSPASADPVDSTPTPTSTPATLEERVASLFEGPVAAGRYVGVMVGVYDRGATRTFAFGRTGPGQGLPRPDTLFEVGSISKTFTAAVLASMARDGAVSLDDAVAGHLAVTEAMPRFGAQEILLWHLASHVSGLPRLPSNIEGPGFDPYDPYAGYTEADLYAFLSGHRLRRAPGGEYEYSNLGYALLGHALTRRAGRSYDDLVRLRVATPLGLPDTLVTPNEDQRARLAQGHDEGGRPVPAWNPGLFDPAAGVRSTTTDLLGYLGANLGAGPADVVADLSAAQQPRFDAGNGLQVGLAWHVLPLSGTPYTMVGHNGGTGGFFSFLGFVRELGIGVVVLTNTYTSVDEPAVEILRWLVTHG